MLNGKAEQPVYMDSQWSKQEACFARATQVWLAINHNNSGKSMLEAYCTGKWDWQLLIKLCNSWGYNRLQKSNDSLKACFEKM